MHKALVVGALLVVLGPLGCSPRETIEVAGSSTILPVVSKAADQFNRDHPDVPIIVNAGGSGVGINQVGEGRADIGMASRDLSRTEINHFPSVSFVTHTIGRDAVVPVVSSEIFEAGVQALTREQIARIYRGELTNWNEVGGPDREILVVDKERSRGTRHVFMEIILGDREADAPGADLVLGSNNEEQTALAQSDGAIGMLSHAWLNDAVKGVALLAPDGAAVAPTLDNIVRGTFPITRPLLLITADEPQGPVKAFIDYLLSPEGQDLVEEAGYVRIQ